MRMPFVLALVAVVASAVIAPEAWAGKRKKPGPLINSSGASGTHFKEATIMKTKPPSSPKPGGNITGSRKTR